MGKLGPSLGRYAQTARIPPAVPRETMYLLTCGSYGRDQTCAMLLAIASGNTFLDPMEQSPVGSMSHVSNDLAAVARQAFYDFGERPTWAERVTYGTSKTAAQRILYGTTDRQYRRRLWDSYIQRQTGRTCSLLCSIGAAILEGAHHESGVCIRCIVNQIVGSGL